MLATRKQISYLQHLTDRADYLKRKHPALIPLGLYHRVWDINMTSEEAGLRIDFYKSILKNADNQLYRR